MAIFISQVGTINCNYYTQSSQFKKWSCSAHRLPGPIIIKIDNVLKTMDSIYLSHKNIELIE